MWEKWNLNGTVDAAETKHVMTKCQKKITPVKLRSNEQRNLHTSIVEMTVFGVLVLMIWCWIKHRCWMIQRRSGVKKDTLTLVPKVQCNVSQSHVVSLTRNTSKLSHHFIYTEAIKDWVNLSCRVVGCIYNYVTEIFTRTVT